MKASIQIQWVLPLNCIFIAAGLYWKCTLNVVSDQQWTGLSIAHDLQDRGSGIIATVTIPKGYVVCDYKGSLNSFRSVKAMEDHINELTTTDYTMTVRIMEFILIKFMFLFNGYTFSRYTVIIFVYKYSFQLSFYFYISICIGYWLHHVLSFVFSHTERERERERESSY